MRFSLELPTSHVSRPEEFVTIDAVAEVTRAARAAGFSAVNVTDHPAPDAKWLDHGGHHALDPFVALAVAASSDPHIRLLTSIYVAAYRNPFLGAQSIHSLQVLSQGRLILGVAAGYLKPEFFALGADFDRRGELLDEALAVLESVSTGDDVVWQSEQASARGVRFRPPAPEGRRPPVWVGGNSRAARRRAARYDGWTPFHTGGFAKSSRTVAIESTPDLAVAIADVKAMAAENGRSEGFDVCWSASLVADHARSVDERVAHVAELEAVGVTWMTLHLQAPDRASLLDEIAAFGRDVIASSSS